MVPVSTSDGVLVVLDVQLLAGAVWVEFLDQGGIAHLMSRTQVMRDPGALEAYLEWIQVCEDSMNLCEVL